MKDFSSFMDKVLDDSTKFDPPKVSFKEFCKLFNPEICTNTPDRKVLLDFVGNLDFAVIEQRLMRSMMAGMQPAVLLGVDIASGRDEGSIAIGVMKEGTLQMLMIDDIRRSPYDGPDVLEMVCEPRKPQQSKIHGLRIDQAIIDDLIALDRESQMPQLVQEEPERRAPNGARPSRKTQAAKAKLPFYHKNRRF